MEVLLRVAYHANVVMSLLFSSFYEHFEAFVIECVFFFLANSTEQTKNMKEKNKTKCIVLKSARTRIY